MCKAQVVQRFKYIMALYHSQMYRHMLKIKSLFKDIEFKKAFLIDWQKN